MDIDEMFIEEVRKHPALYDLSIKEYKNIKKKDHAWQEISRRVKLNDVQCKKRWRALRDCYKRCKRNEVMASGSGALPPKQKWRYYDQLSFLDSIQSTRKTVGNASHDEESQEAINDVVLLDLETQLDFSMSEDTAIPSAQKPSHSKRSNRENKFNEFLDKASASISETCSVYVNRNTETDSTGTLFASLAAAIKEAHLPLNVLNRIRSRVSQIVYQEIQPFSEEEEAQAFKALISQKLLALPVVVNNYGNTPSQGFSSDNNHYPSNGTSLSSAYYANVQHHILHSLDATHHHPLLVSFLP